MAYTHLSPEERYQIQALMHIKASKSTIAKTLGRSRATIYRELARVRGRYNAPRAQQQRNRCARTSAANARRWDWRCWRAIKVKLKQDWSPQQIAGRARQQEHKPSPSWQAIYKWIKRVWPRKRKYEIPLRRRGKAGIANWAEQAQPIRRRPREVNKRQQVGHWEADSMLAGHGRSSDRLLVAVERASRFVRISKMADGQASTCTKAIKKIVLHNKRFPFESVTTDRGSEFSELPALLGKRMYVCDAYRPNQRGTNENSIGLLRQYIPKGMPISLFNARQLARIEQKLNNRPRACLNFKTPAEVLFELHPRCIASN